MGPIYVTLFENIIAISFEIGFPIPNRNAMHGGVKMTGEREKQKVHKLIEMGKRAHMLVREGQIGDQELSLLSDQLVKLDAEANAYLGKRPPVRSAGVCPHCNMHFEGSFCGGCGLNIDEYFAKPVHSCEICGFIVEADGNYCGVCGSKRRA